MRLRIPWKLIFRITGFRKRRMQLFEQIMQLTNFTHILDVGGSIMNWQFISTKPRLTLLNIDERLKNRNYPENIKFVTGNALELQFEDDEFDIGFSNSVIEHVSTWQNQRQFANEIRRVSKRLWVQTPAYEFFLEPHLITPFIHWLPDDWKRLMLRNFTFWGLITRPNKKEIENYIETIRLINYNEMKFLFPDCVIIMERWLGIPRSYIAYSK